MAGYWRITNIYNNKINKDSVTLANWNSNSIPSAEGITLLNFVYYVFQVAKHIKRGSIKIYHNNYKIVNNVKRQRNKIIDYTIDSTSATLKIR